MKLSNGFNEKLQLNSVNLKFKKPTSPFIYAKVLKRWKLYSNLKAYHRNISNLFE